jgi:metal-sulfur cluster biosynthetic enzyme
MPEHELDRTSDENNENNGSGEDSEDEYDPAGGGSGPTYCAYTDYTQDGPTADSLPATGEEATGLERRVWEALYGIADPEMPVSIVDLGLLYGVRVIENAGDEGSGGGGDDKNGDARVVIDMTLTYTGCPARKMLTDEVAETVGEVNGVGDVDLDLVWSPSWSLSMVTDQGRADLREFGLSVPDAEEAT